MTLTDDTLLGLAADLARRAGAAILGVRARPFAVDTKADQSPVTAADHAAEAIILEGLRRVTPDIPVFAEEEMAAAETGSGGGAGGRPAEYWLVDPLDGTREFAAGTDDFTVNIGLVRDGRAALGAVAVPAFGELFCGIVGVGATRRDIAGERRIACRRPPPDGLAVLASRHYASDPRLAEFLRGRPVATVTHLGSAIKFLRVAEGVADLYPRFGRTMEWDTAAPQAIVEAAGGAVRHFDGRPFDYGRADFGNPPFVVTGRT